MLIAFIAAIAQAGGVVIDKIIFRQWRIATGSFVIWLFFFLALFTGLVVIGWGSLGSLGILRGIEGIWFGGMIVVAIGWNILYYRCLKHERLQDFELIIMLSPLATVLMAAAVFPDERQLRHFIAAVLASLALIIARFRRHHLVFSHWTWLTLLAMLLMSAESLFIKKSLEVFSPTTLYFLRTTILAILFMLFWPSKLTIGWRPATAIAGSAIFGVILMILKFSAFQRLGVVETTLILVLAPVLVYLGDILILKEKPNKRHWLAAAAIIVLIFWSQI